MVLAFVSPTFAADNAQEFVNKAAVGGMFEVESSKVALDKAEDQSVKDFAQKMIDDHGAANAKLETIAGEQKLQVPADLDAKHKADLDALNAAAAPVDETYVKLQRAAHAEAVTLFESYSQDGDNATLKAFAAETLPTLKMHQQMVDGMKPGMDHNAAGSETSTCLPPAPPILIMLLLRLPVPTASLKAKRRAVLKKPGIQTSRAWQRTTREFGGARPKDGKATSVALDFEGNVVATAN